MDETVQSWTHKKPVVVISFSVEFHFLLHKKKKKKKKPKRGEGFSLVCFAPGRNETSSSSCIHDGVKEEEEGIKENGFVVWLLAAVLRPWLFGVPDAIGRWLFSFFPTHFVQMCAKCQGQGRVLGCLFGSGRGTTTSTSHPAPALSSLPSLVFWPRKFPNWISNSTQFFWFIYLIYLILF